MPRTPAEPVEEIPVARLKEDLSLYPRRRIDTTNISTLVEAYEAFNAGEGDEPPPIIVTRGKVIVDGVHRARAKRKVYGDDATISCIVRHYRTKAEMFYDACMLNSGRGHDLSRWDQLHCVELARELKLPIERLAKALGWTSERLLSFSERRATRASRPGFAAAAPPGHPSPPRRAGWRFERSAIRRAVPGCGPG